MPFLITYVTAWRMFLPRLLKWVLWLSHTVCCEVCLFSLCLHGFTSSCREIQDDSDSERSLVLALTLAHYPTVLANLCFTYFLLMLNKIVLARIHTFLNWQTMVLFLQYILGHIVLKVVCFSGPDTGVMYWDIYVYFKILFFLDVISFIQLYPTRSWQVNMKCCEL